MRRRGTGRALPGYLARILRLVLLATAHHWVQGSPTSVSVTSPPLSAHHATCSGDGAQAHVRQPAQRSVQAAWQGAGLRPLPQGRLMVPRARSQVPPPSRGSPAPLCSFPDAPLGKQGSTAFCSIECLSQVCAAQAAVVASHLTPAESWAGPARIAAALLGCVVPKRRLVSSSRPSTGVQRFNMQRLGAGLQA